MGLLDTLTGGANKDAARALREAQDRFGGIALPTAEQLTLPELQKYVQAGVLTPAEAEAILVQGNAYNDINLDPGAMEAMQKSLGQLQNVSEKGGMTDTMKARLTQALDQVATNTRGNNASILDQFAQKGIPKSLMAASAMQAESADAARNANLTATQAAGDAEMRAIQAMMGSGELASSMRGQQYKEASDKAAAENAIKQWNAGTQTNINEANAGRGQEANAYNMENAQNTSDKNVANSNTRTAYNANIPQQQFQNAMSKATGQAGVSESQANQYTNAGNQMMGLIGAGIGAGSAAMRPGAKARDPNALYAAHGAVVPGEAEVPGDSSENDTVKANLSPNEVVLPRSVTMRPDAPDAAKGFVQSLIREKKLKPVHPEDVGTILDVLTNRRG